MSARDPRFITRLARDIRGEIREVPSLGRFSTYRIGGPGTVLLPASVEDVAAGRRLAAESGIPVFALGLGSNVLLPDEGLDALVIRFGKGLDQVRQEGPTWWLGAGLPAPLAARKTAGQGWAGIHMMVGVPGTVGGGIYMNAGCHGGQWSDVTVRVSAVDATGELRSIPAAEIPFAYRRSGLGELVVVEAEVRLHQEEREALDAEVERLFAWRQAGTPFNQPCCGSVFKNPPGVAPAGWSRPWTAGSLIESAGLKGTRAGGAEISPMHANYFVNTAEATAADVRSLIEKAREAVAKQFGVVLETEVKVIGRNGEYAGSFTGHSS
jgi:UDP-N-acetylmuramate dehydrogenase